MTNYYKPNGGNPIRKPLNVRDVLNALIDARADVEDAGYRSPSCLLVSKAALKALSYLIGGVPVTESLLTAANINSLHRAKALDENGPPLIDIDYRGVRKLQDNDEGDDVDDEGNDDGGDEKKPAKKAAAKKAAAAQDTDDPLPEYESKVMLLLGRRQRIAHGGAGSASPGEEPVDLAVSVPPSLEVVGETYPGRIELAVRIRYALRIKDAYGVRRSRLQVRLKVHSPRPPWTCSRTTSPRARTPATARSTGSTLRVNAGRAACYDLILDYPLRGGKALRPALGIATCLGLGGDLEAILPTAATLELYHNAFLIHDDIEDESWWRRGKPTLHIDHGIPIAVNVGDAMLSLSLQPLLDNVERVGLGPALRILRAVAHMTRQTVEGQAIELEWVRSNTWRLDDADYLEMVELKTSWYSFITPLQVGAIAAGAGPERIGAAGVSRPASRSGLSDHRRPTEPAGGSGGVRQGDRRRPLGGQADADVVARLAMCRAERPRTGRADSGQAAAERGRRA